MANYCLLIGLSSEDYYCDFPHPGDLAFCVKEEEGPSYVPNISWKAC